MTDATGGARPTSRRSYRPAEIVVALEHLDEVERELAYLGVKPDPARAARSRRLGLALLPLVDLEAAVARLPEPEHTAPQRPGRAPAGDGSALDALMGALRRRFADRYAGWQPTMGKNRYVEGLEGLGEIGANGDGAPRPAGDPPPPGGGEPRPDGEIGGGSTRPLGEIGGGGGGGPRPLGEIGGGGRGGPRATDPPLHLAYDPQPGRRVEVGVLDTAMVAHPELVGRFVADRPPLPYSGAAPRPFFSGHATFIAGLILHRAPGAELHARSVLADADGTASAWDVANKIVEFADSGVALLNLSLGCVTPDGEAPLVLQRAIERLGPDTVVIAAAGNYPPPGAAVDRPLWPAALPGVIAVGAYDPAAPGRPAEFSREQPWVRAMAPGVDVLSTYLDGPVSIAHRDADGGATEVRRRHFTGFARWSGSSFAAATVTGLVAAATRPGQVSAREAAQALLTSPAGPTYL
ncbi:MAG TPA: S8 family serine peptidase [Pilimelia sp.]|nr:S8 family serine peptidase [Pilimelia sp.]